MNESCDMEFDVRSQKSGADKEMQVEGRLEKAGIQTAKSSKKGKKALTKTEKQLQKQNDLIAEALKMGLNSQEMA